MAIIPPTNAVVHPRTVVVEILREHGVKRTGRWKIMTISTNYSTSKSDAQSISTSHAYTWKTKNRTDLG